MKKRWQKCPRCKAGNAFFLGDGKWECTICGFKQKEIRQTQLSSFFPSK